MYNIYIYIIIYIYTYIYIFMFYQRSYPRNSCRNLPYSVACSPQKKRWEKRARLRPERYLEELAKTESTVAKTPTKQLRLTAPGGGGLFGDDGHTP